MYMMKLQKKKKIKKYSMNEKNENIHCVLKKQKINSIKWGAYMENNITYTFSENGPTFQEIIEEIYFNDIDKQKGDWLLYI